jgi:hypothetical protein
MVARIDGAHELREFVHQTLCDHHELVPGGFPFTERMLSRRGKQCGILFCQYGPRNVKFTAIWDCEQNIVLFYGCSGERILRVDVMTSA